MATKKTYPTIVVKLDSNAPQAYVFAMQAKTGETALTPSQIEAARNAAKSVLEITGADVAAMTSVLALDAIEENQSGRLTIACAQEIEEENE